MAKRKKKDDEQTPLVQPTGESVTANSKASFSFDSVDDIHENIIGESSEPNEDAINAHQKEAQEKQERLNSLVDSAGTKFDPNIHAVNAEGEPSVTSSGKFRRKRGAGSRVSVPSRATAAQVATEQAAEQAKKDARAAGQLCADMLVNTAVIVGGKEWEPKVNADYNEQDGLRKAFSDYFEAKGVKDFPPGIALTLAVSAYATPRFFMPETKSKTQRFKLWLTEKWINRKRKNAAQSNTRNDGKRENNSSKETSSKEPSK